MFSSFGIKGGKRQEIERKNGSKWKVWEGMGRKLEQRLAEGEFASN